MEIWKPCMLSCLSSEIVFNSSIYKVWSYFDLGFASSVNKMQKKTSKVKLHHINYYIFQNPLLTTQHTHTQGQKQKPIEQPSSLSFSLHT